MKKALIFSEIYTCGAMSGVEECFVQFSSNGDRYYLKSTITISNVELLLLDGHCGWKATMGKADFPELASKAGLELAHWEDLTKEALTSGDQKKYQLEFVRGDSILYWRKVLDELGTKYLLGQIICTPLHDDQLQQGFRAVLDSSFAANSNKSLRLATLALENPRLAQEKEDAIAGIAENAQASRMFFDDEAGVLANMASLLNSHKDKIREQQLVIDKLRNLLTNRS